MVILEKLKYITICYYWTTNNVKLMLQEHYDLPEYKNTVFLLNTYNICDYTKNDIDFINTHNNIIYYMLEHKLKDNFYTEQVYQGDSNYFASLYNAIHYTEWWTMDYEPQSNKIIRDNLNIPIKYKPVRYTTLVPQVKNIYTTKKTIDFCHIGGLSSSHRMDLIRKFEALGCQISFKFITQTGDIKSCITNMNDSRFMLDTLRIDTIATPNQVRIFELLCMGYTVCTEKCKFNMFPGLVYEWETPEDLIEIANRNEYLHPTEAYREMTYTDEAYGQYVNNLIKLQS